MQHFETHLQRRRLRKLRSRFRIVHDAGGAPFRHVSHFDLIIEDLPDDKSRREAHALVIVGRFEAERPGRAKNGQRSSQVATARTDFALDRTMWPGSHFDAGFRSQATSREFPRIP